MFNDLKNKFKSTKPNININMNEYNISKILGSLCDILKSSKLRFIYRKFIKT
jgi:hypothetical protein